MDSRVEQQTCGQGRCRGWITLGRCLPPTRLVALLLLGGLAWGWPGWSEPKRYDPDTDTCQAEVIRRAYQANLLPWLDQPEAVLRRLRQLQAAMTLDTLRDCQARGLLSPAQAASLEAQLDLKATSASPTTAPEPDQSPMRP
jgi:hypothetical protein